MTNSHSLPPKGAQGLRPLAPPGAAHTPAREPNPARAVRYHRTLDAVATLSEEEKQRLSEVTLRFPFRSNDYYLSLIDWSDPNDPIRRIILPDPQELEDWGQFDASDERRWTVAPGCEHKYPRVAVLLLTDVCGGYCRFCFRKRLFQPGSEEVLRDLRPGLDYIRRHPRITNVLLTGGDPLVFSANKLEHVIQSVFDIPHIQIVRIGTKMPAFNPHRILEDAELPRLISRYSQGRRRIYIMTHFNHPKEITEPAAEAVERLARAGATLCNQTPMIHGVNDSPETLAKLFQTLAAIGDPPYYVFQCRPTLGNRPYAVPLARALAVFQEARSRVGGLAKRARLVMSHATGKIEILGMDTAHFFLRYHRAPDPAMESRIFLARRDDSAYWFDDLQFPGGSPASQAPPNASSFVGT